MTQMNELEKFIMPDDAFLVALRKEANAKFFNGLSEDDKKFISTYHSKVDPEKTEPFINLVVSLKEFHYLARKNRFRIAPRPQSEKEELVVDKISDDVVVLAKIHLDVSKKTSRYYEPEKKTIEITWDPSEVF